MKLSYLEKKFTFPHDYYLQVPHSRTQQASPSTNAFSYLFKPSTDSIIDMIFSR